MRKRAYRVLIITLILTISLLAVCPLSFAQSDIFQLDGNWYIRYDTNNTVGIVYTNSAGQNPAQFSYRDFTSSTGAISYGTSIMQWFAFTSSELVTVNPEWFFVEWSYCSIGADIVSLTFYIVPDSYNLQSMPAAGPESGQYGYRANYQNKSGDLVLVEDETNTSVSGPWKCLCVFYYSSSIKAQDLYFKNLYVANGRGDLQTWISNNISPDLGLDADREEIKDALDKTNQGAVKDMFDWVGQFDLGQYLAFGNVIDRVIDGTGLGVVYNFALTLGFCGIVIGTIAIIGRRFRR